MQGYEDPEHIYRMYGLNSEQFQHLNPGQGWEMKRGDSLCVRGVWDVSEDPASWFWPAAVAVGVAVAFVASLFLSKPST